MRHPRFARRLGEALLLLSLVAPPSAHADVPPASASGSRAIYRVRFSPGSSRIGVTATLPIAGAALRMETTRPAGIPELDSLSWAGLVSEPRVTDSAGRPRPVRRDRTRGWTLASPETTTLTLAYEVDYAPLERLGWPAEREAAYRDSANFVLIGRSLFVTTEVTGECRVTFELPDGWSATTPWPRATGRQSFVAPSPRELVENMLVLSRGPVDEVIARNFHLHVFALGHWATSRAEVRRVLQPVIRHHVTLMGHDARTDYVVVLFPRLESGAESFRSSFALTTDTPGPSASPIWGNLVAHEIFHLWNGWRLHGADYVSTQWFHEGFTEYAANLAIASSGMVDAGWLREKLARHVENARRLTTTLENTGGRKGPPLYSAGALVAFSWDTRIREATSGRRDLGDFLRELMRRTDGGGRGYTWSDVQAALAATASGDWERDYQSFIHGDQRMPVEPALARVGHRLVEAADSTVRVEPDPAAAEAARARWAMLLRGPREPRR